MGEHHESFGAAELCIVTTACKACGNVISFDVRTDEAFGFPKRCSVCETPLGPAATAIQAYRKFYQAAAGLKLELRTESRGAERL
jgi:hypothetical protein